MVFDITQLGTELIDPLVVLGNSLIVNLPGIIAALLIIILGYIVGSVVGLVVRKIVEKVKVDEWLKKSGRNDSIGEVKLSKISGKLIKWWIFLIFLTPAANAIQLERLSSILTQFALWAPHLIAGIVIIIAGLIFADFLADSAAQAKRLKGIKSISVIIRVVTIIFFADIALREIGINITFAETIFLMIIGGIILVLVIGLGIGLIKPAQEIISNFVKKLR